MSSLGSEQMAGDAVSILDDAAPDLIYGAAFIPDADCGVNRNAKVEDDYKDDHEENQDDDLNEKLNDESGDDHNDGTDDHCDKQIDEPTDAQTDAQPDDHNDEQADESTDQTETTDTQTDDQNSDQTTDDSDEQLNEPAPHDDDFLHEVEAWRAYFQQEWLTHGGILRWTTHRVLPAAGALALSALFSTPAMYILHLLHLNSYLTDSPDGSEWPLRFRFTDQLTDLEWMGALFCVLVVWHQYLFKVIFQEYRTTRAGAARYLDVLGLVSCLFCMPGLNGWVVGQMYGLTFAVLHLHLLCMLGLYDSAVWARKCARRLFGLRDEICGDDDDDDADVAQHDLALLFDLYHLL
ncbi:hypothetical protein ASPACDRAFT_42454 [Aspergillus aculeatus ATCC 16872]|uniref:Uncharacterized protein n=1 Tax=Aspergillus aculeatus (strain ATCC 16872 / CBS 172.66 / WB 5094) TaxID=690307 RepID=A0A1L9WXR6_ASPA1|nr:uncharacterized protein ASPACDRAFT_42454 [Aspergillus aculeatus ATCC 16872]OJK00954.1 hypothetical protein ASPACDRAFT_42454 [Aspergillus aculeatus ATCC 16872]